MDPSPSLRFLSLGGIAIALHAVVRDLLHVEWARFGADGLHIRWSYVLYPRDTRVEKEQQCAWRGHTLLAECNSVAPPGQRGLFSVNWQQPA